MMQRQVFLEWNIVETDSLWQSLAASGTIGFARDSRAHTAEAWLTYVLIRSAALVLISFLVVAGVAQPLSVREQIRANNGIYVALAREEKAFREDDDAAFAALIDTQAAGRWQHVWNPARATADLPNQLNDASSTVRLLRMEQANDLTMAEVLVRRPAFGWTGFNPYRELRFYRETSAGWLRTVPDSEFWGAAQVMESEHLRFEMSASDAPFVEAGAAAWDEIYRSLHDLLGLSLPPNDEKISFVIVPEPVRGRSGDRARYELTSPLLVQIPDYLSPADYFTQTVVSRLTYNVVAKFPIHRDNGEQSEEVTLGRWRMVRRGLRSWLRSELLQPDWPWDREAVSLFHDSLDAREPLSLSVISSRSLRAFTDREELLWQTAAMASVFAYVSEAHGADQLIEFIHAFKNHRTWDDLIPAVLTISLEEFETGWNQWLVLRREAERE